MIPRCLCYCLAAFVEHVAHLDGELLSNRIDITIGKGRTTSPKTCISTVEDTSYYVDKMKYMSTWMNRISIPDSYGYVFFYTSKLTYMLSWAELHRCMVRGCNHMQACARTQLVAPFIAESAPCLPWSVCPEQNSQHKQAKIQMNMVTNTTAPTFLPALPLLKWASEILGRCRRTNSNLTYQASHLYLRHLYSHIHTRTLRMHVYI